MSAAPTSSPPLILFPRKSQTVPEFDYSWSFQDAAKGDHNRVIIATGIKFLIEVVSSFMSNPPLTTSV